MKKDQKPKLTEAAIDARITAQDGEPSSRNPSVLRPLRSSSSRGQVFTAVQGRYLAFIYIYTRLHGIPPAETDIQRCLSSNSCFLHPTRIDDARARRPHGPAFTRRHIRCTGRK